MPDQTRDQTADVVRTPVRRDQSPNVCKMGLDIIMVAAGEFGIYQRRIFALLCLVGIPYSLFNTGPVFWGRIPLYKCNDTKSVQEHNDHHNNRHFPNQESALNKESGTRNGQPGERNVSAGSSTVGLNPQDVFGEAINGACYESGALPDRNRSQIHGIEEEPCVNFTFYPNDTSVVSRWSLVCQNKWRLALLHHMYTFGQIAGCLLAGYLSDRVGRRVTLVVCTAVQIPVSVLVSVVPDFVAFTVLRTLLAAATTAQFNTAFILVIELLGPAWRVFGGTVFLCFLPIGNLMLTGAAFYNKNYVALKLLTSIPLASLLIYIWVLPESVRWMYARGQSEDVRGQLKYITEVNRIEGADDLADRQLENSERVRVPFDLAVRPLLRKKVAVLSYIWWICMLVLTTVNYELLVRAPDRTLVLVPASAAFDFGVYVFAMLCLYKLGRRLPLTIALILTGIALQCTAPAPLELKHFHTGMLALVRALCTLSGAMLRVYSAELLPTALRGSGMGVIAAVSFTGANIMPFILKLHEIHVDLPHVLEGGLCVLAALSVLFIPTTWKQPLPDTIQEGEHMGTNQHMLFFVVEERGGSITSRCIRPKSHSVATTTPRPSTRPRFSLPDGKLRLNSPSQPMGRRLTVPDGVGISREKRKSWHTLLPEGETVT